MDKTKTSFKHQLVRKEASFKRVFSRWSVSAEIEELELSRQCLSLILETKWMNWTKFDDCWSFFPGEAESCIRVCASDVDNIRRSTRLFPPSHSHSSKMGISNFPLSLSGHKGTQTTIASELLAIYALLPNAAVSFSLSN